MIEPGIEQLKADLVKLEAELVEVESFLEKVPAMEKRRRELLSGWKSFGEINYAKRKIRNASLPLCPGFSDARIVSVDSKWITIRFDYADDEKVVRYKRDNGWRERSRSSWGAIHALSVVEAWEAHQKKGSQC